MITVTLYATYAQTRNQKNQEFSGVKLKAAVRGFISVKNIYQYLKGFLRKQLKSIIPEDDHILNFGITD